MKRYLYPKNLRSKASLWLWSLRDFSILCVGALISALALAKLAFVPPAALTLCFAFLTIRREDFTILDYINYAVRYFISTQQYFEWR